MQRIYFQHDGLELSYLDTGGENPVLIALHAQMEAATFRRLAAMLTPKWRVVALDQRGHGWFGHPRSYHREDYLGDLEALHRCLGIDRAVLLGHSLGGVNAYQFAARHPEQVAAVIIEDIETVIESDASSTLQWAGSFPTREALVGRVGSGLAPYLEDSFRQEEGAWRLGSPAPGW